MSTQRAVETKPARDKRKRDMKTGKVIKAKDPARALVEAIAMDIGKTVVHHIENMFPEAYARLPQKGLSVRNCTYNEIIAALDVTDEGRIIARLKYRAKHRRTINRLRKAKSVAEVRDIMGRMDLGDLE